MKEHELLEIQMFQSVFVKTENQKIISFLAIPLKKRLFKKSD